MASLCDESGIRLLDDRQRFEGEFLKQGEIIRCEFCRTLAVHLYVTTPEMLTNKYAKHDCVFLLIPQSQGSKFSTVLRDHSHDM
jgi:hypothetical protein